MSVVALTPVERLLWLLAPVGYGCLLARLFLTGLLRVYRVFAFYLAFRFVRTLVLFQYRPGTQDYAVIWAVTEPAIWLLHILVIRELVGLVMARYPGISTVGRWALGAAVVVSILISALTLTADFANPGGLQRAIFYFSVARRGLSFSLLLFLLLLALFLVAYSVPLKRNLAVHTVVYSLYFLTHSWALLVQNITGSGVTRTVSTVLVAVNLLCLFLWTVFLSRQGEVTSARLGLPTPAQEARLLARLDALNETLLRACRR